MIFAIALAMMPAFAQLSLADAQDRAAANSVDMQIAAATVREREASLRIARSSGVPHIAGDYSLAPQAGPLDTGTVEQHYLAFGAGVSINDLVASSSSVRAAAADLLAAQRKADAARLAARENGAKLYFAALQATAVERFRVADVTGALRDRIAAGLRARSGESPQLDVVRSDVTLARARADAARAQADRANAVDALCSATGVAPADLANLTLVTTPSEVPLDVDRAIARALAARPELAALLATVQARDADVAGARLSVVPATTIEAGYQKGVDTGIPVQGPQAAIHVDLPLASAAGDRVATARAHVDAASAQLVDERRRIALEVAAAVRDARADGAAAAGAQRARDEAQRALAVVEIGYREGASSSLDVADARRTYEQASVDALVAQYQHELALAILAVIVP